MDEKITSRDNPKVKYACKLADSPGFRRSEGRFFAEGRKLCPELAKGAALEQLFYTAAAAQKCPELAGLPGQHFLVEEHVAQKLAGVPAPQGVFGVFRTPAHTLEEVRPGGRYLALEGVQDPGNVGTLLRSAASRGHFSAAAAVRNSVSSCAARASSGHSLRPSAKKRPSLRRNAPLAASLQAYLIRALSRLVIFSMVCPPSSPQKQKQGRPAGRCAAAGRGPCSVCLPGVQGLAAFQHIQNRRPRMRAGVLRFSGFIRRSSQTRPGRQSCRDR